MAADSLQTIGTIRVGHMQKIMRREDGTLVGAAGNASYVQKLMGWAKSKAKTRPPLPDDEGTGLVVSPRGKITILDALGPSANTSEFIAIGSGADIALGAMAFGATAVEAVEVALKMDCMSGGNISSLTHR